MAWGGESYRQQRFDFCLRRFHLLFGADEIDRAHGRSDRHIGVARHLDVAARALLQRFDVLTAFACTPPP